MLRVDDAKMRDKWHNISTLSPYWIVCRVRGIHEKEFIEEHH